MTTETVSIDANVLNSLLDWYTLATPFIKGLEEEGPDFILSLPEEEMMAAFQSLNDAVLKLRIQIEEHIL